MMRRGIVIFGVMLLAACAHPDARAPVPLVGQVADLQIIAFNDFHGHIGPDDQTVLPPGAPSDAPRVKAGGAVYFAAAVARLRADNPNSAVVSAGDLISASPLVSGHFLDEPTVRVMNDIGIDFSAVGNHEYDRGPRELGRMQSGGCAKYTLREPCQVMPDFPGASFRFLAANSITADGKTLFAPYGIKTLNIGGQKIRIGFVGMTLKGTPAIVSPSAVAGIRFADEAETANALIPALRAAGADILAVLIHEGGVMKADADQGNCGNLTGDLNPILAKLDPAFDLVISGHTHQAYVCDYGSVDPQRPFLVTSAGQYSTLLTRISLRYDLAAHKLVSKSAENLVVAQSAEAVTQQPAIAALVTRYQDASAKVRDRVIGTLGGPLVATTDRTGQSTLGNFVADAQLAAMAPADKGGAQLAFMNAGGLRSPITPTAQGQGQGQVRYGDVYVAQPFGNSLIVKPITGAQIRAALEYQFTRASPELVSVSQGFSYAYDMSKPEGQRVSAIMLNGQPIRDDATYRVAMNNFMGQGGDGFTMFADAPLLAEGPVDVDALEAYIAARPGIAPPAFDRIRNLTPQ